MRNFFLYKSIIAYLIHNCFSVALAHLFQNPTTNSSYDKQDYCEVHLSEHTFKSLLINSIFCTHTKSEITIYRKSILTHNNRFMLSL